jgi:hypothetical protein
MAERLAGESGGEDKAISSASIFPPFLFGRLPGLPARGVGNNLSDFFDISYVLYYWHIRPMLFQYLLAEFFVHFAKQDSFYSCPLTGKGEATNAAE